MSHKGFSHIGLSTLDLDKTRAFYEGVLGFKPVRCDTIKVKEGGQIRHIFFDTGRDQLLAFMEARGVPGVPAEYDAGINRGLGVPSAFYHFAFETGSLPGRVNTDLVEIAEPDDADEQLLQRLIREHEEKTVSPRARTILVQWAEYLPLFRKVAPKGAFALVAAAREAYLRTPVEEPEQELARRSA